MPLHDWNTLTDWESVHTYWIAGLGRWLKPQLPAGYRSSVATIPNMEVALAALDPARLVHVTRAGNLVAVIELISPRNKDRAETRRSTTDRFLGYLKHGIHLLYVDIHPRPQGFSFADELAAAVQFPAPPCPAPCAVSYRVRVAAPQEGLYLGAWQRPLTVGDNLPILPLFLTGDVCVAVDLEQTYARAAADAYL